ncbi:MAG: 3-phosphoshikimate 1-carboxyvinyltransferase [Bacteroidales bacterium]|nr:3-phosphoshikimate 1-carboxyvinyltransferase [Bacteroidales bacterium]
MRIIGGNKNFDVTANLVGSKSESNRALMIAYYGGLTPRIKNLSTSDDTKLLKEILDSLQSPTNPTNPTNPITPRIINCYNSGTVLRFLLTALSVGPWRAASCILTGSERMQQRPIGDLVDALREIGADIRYMGEEGFPPVEIHPVETCHGASMHNTISVDITKSSQFASSLLLAMPSLIGMRRATTLHLDGDLSSLPYIDMTIAVMQKFGAKIHRDDRDIVLQPSDYQDVEYCVESDWTCASYWYEAVALSENGHARLKNLHLDSKQGDAVVAKWFEKFGVKSVQDGVDVVITRVEPLSGVSHDDMDYSFDFINNPDLYPTIAATCAGLGVEGHFKGLRNLKHKESDRVAAMTTELVKTHGRASQSSVQTCHGASLPIFDSHDDHRIAMALALLAMKIGAIEINDADVVSKSYPNFWEEFTPILK